MSKSTTADGRRSKTTKVDSHELNSNIVKAMSHPLRLRILARLNEGVASPNEMAKEFGESLPLVSYHVRILRELNCIELVKTTPRRGAIEHHYRALTRAFLDEKSWAQIPESARRAVSSAGLEKGLDDVREAMAANTFDERLDRHQTYSPLLLDEQAWVELNAKLMDVLDWALEEQSSAAVRIRDEGAKDMRARLLMLTYTGAPPRAPGEPKGRRAKR